MCGMTVDLRSNSMVLLPNIHINVLLNPCRNSSNISPAYSVKSCFSFFDFWHGCLNAKQFCFLKDSFAIMFCPSNDTFYLSPIQTSIIT